MTQTHRQAFPAQNVPQDLATVLASILEKVPPLNTDAFLEREDFHVDPTMNIFK